MSETGLPERVCPPETVRENGGGQPGQEITSGTKPDTSVRRSGRVTKRPTHSKDYVVDNLECSIILFKLMAKMVSMR